MVGNLNAVGAVVEGVITPVRAKWFNNGTEELLLEIDDQSRPVNPAYSSWARGKCSTRHPRVVAIRAERAREQKEQKEQKSK